MVNFRTVEFWKESIMTLPDSSFFELLRTVFGKVKTPFNKQLLMSDLEKFLLRDDIKKNIACYISHGDSLIIAAVAVLNEPVPGDLESFFAGELSYMELQDLIINLEERFILYRFFEEKQNRRLSRLALNPVLKSILMPVASDTSLLFPSIAANEIPRNAAMRDKPPPRDYPLLVDDRIIAALLSFVYQNKLFFRAGGVIRRKVGNAAQTLFPNLPMEMVIGGLQILGLFFTEDETLVPDYPRLSAFGALSRQERLAYCAAGIMCYGESRSDASTGSISPWLLRPRIRGYAEIINRLYNSLDPDCLYPHTTLQKLAYILGLDSIKNESDSIIPAAKTSSGEFLNVMEKTGMIVSAADMHWYKAPLAESPKPDSPPIVMDTPFTFMVYPEIAYNDAISLASFSNVIEAGMIVRFELSRDSVVQAFNRGFTAAAMTEILQRVTHNRISDILSFTLCDWEKQHGEVALRRGLVLTLSPDQCHLAQTKPLSRFITETLAPGVYMLEESAEEKAIMALNKAGVAIIANRGQCRAEDSSVGSTRHFFLSLHAAKPQTGEPSRASNADDSSAILIERFQSILERMKLGSEARDELTARINRRLVLCESQLKDAVVRYEKLEARGLDYVGKALIAKQAITLQAPIEVICPGKQKQERIIGIPKALEKAGSESILIIELLGEKNTVRISLGKISLLRRIKKSIFEG